MVWLEGRAAVLVRADIRGGPGRAELSIVVVKHTAEERSLVDGCHRARYQVQVASSGGQEPAVLGVGQVADWSGAGPIPLPQGVVRQVVGDLDLGIWKPPLDRRKGARGISCEHRVVQGLGLAGVPQADPAVKPKIRG